MTCAVPVTIALFIGIFIGVLVNSIFTMLLRDVDNDHQTHQ